MSTTPAPTPPTPCLEIAVYTVRPSEADTFPARQAAMHAALRTLPGFVAAERLRGLDTPALFADCIVWASRAAAESAAALLPTLPGAGGFVAAIAEMRTFAHLPVAPPPDSAGAPTVAADGGAPAGHSDAA